MTRQELNSFILNLLPNNIRRLINPTRTRDALAKVADYAEELQAADSPWKGEASTSTNPPSSGFYIYNVLNAGTYTNFRDSNNASITVLGSEIQNNRVELWVQNGVSKKVLYPTGGGSGSGDNFANKNLTFTGNRTHNALGKNLSIDDINHYELRYRNKTEQLFGQAVERKIIPNYVNLGTIFLDVDYSKIENSGQIPTEIYQHVQPYSGDQEIMQLQPPTLTSTADVNPILDFGTQKYGYVRSDGQYDEDDTLTFTYAVPFENGSVPMIIMASVGSFERVIVNVEPTNRMTDPTMKFGFNVRFGDADNPGTTVNLPWFYYLINGH